MVSALGTSASRFLRAILTTAYFSAGDDSMMIYLIRFERIRVCRSRDMAVNSEPRGLLVQLRSTCFHEPLKRCLELFKLFEMVVVISRVIRKFYAIVNGRADNPRWSVPQRDGAAWAHVYTLIFCLLFFFSEIIFLNHISFGAWVLLCKKKGGCGEGTWQVASRKWIKMGSSGENMISYDVKFDS